MVSPLSFTATLGHWLQGLWSIAFRKKSLAKNRLQKWLFHVQWIPLVDCQKVCLLWFWWFRWDDDLEDFDDVDYFLGPQEIRESMCSRLAEAATLAMTRWAETSFSVSCEAFGWLGSFPGPRKWWFQSSKRNVNQHKHTKTDINRYRWIKIDINHDVFESGE